MRVSILVVLLSYALGIASESPSDKIEIIKDTERASKQENLQIANLVDKKINAGDKAAIANQDEWGKVGISSKSKKAAPVLPKVGEIKKMTADTKLKAADVKDPIVPPAKPASPPPASPPVNVQPADTINKGHQGKAEVPVTKKTVPSADDDIIPDDEEEEVTIAKAKALEVELPPSLNLDNFDQIVGEKLSLVEFYSPYCSHCKALAPTWEQTYKEFYEDMKKLKVQMRQVNCVENGDLCEKEDIAFYPNLRLYSPVRDAADNAKSSGKYKHVDTFPRTLVKTPENFKKYLQNAVAEYNEGLIDLPSSSQQLDSDSMLKIIAGEIDEPIFVSFFPSTDKDWKTMDESSKNMFRRECVDCLEYKHLWDKLSNHKLSINNTGHLNCYSHPKLCSKLGFDKLVSEHPVFGVTPKFAMFLPKSTGLIRLDYTDEIDVKEMKKWCTKLKENYKFELIKSKALPEILDVRKILPQEPLNTYYPLANKMSLVYFYDAENIAEEDNSILPYLLEYVMNSPFQISLYQSHDVKILKNIQSQGENIVKFINYDKSLPEPAYEYNNPMFLATTLTSKPTLMLFKENVLITPIFQHYALENMRNDAKVKRFIEENQYPLYQELTPKLMSTYFPKKFPSPKTQSLISKGKDEKVVITFINSEDASETNALLYNLSMTAHEYYYLKKEYYFNDLTERRENKKEFVAKLSKGDGASDKIIEEMRKEIPHFFQNNEVLFTFIDTATNPGLASKYGWDITSEGYSVGDSIVVSRNEYQYWNKDITGQEKLRNDPYMMKPVLQYLLDPKLVKATNVKVKSLLIGSPYPNSLRFMDCVHAHGFLGYTFLWVALYACIWAFKKYKRRRHGRLPKSETGLGILGKRD